MLRVRRQYRDKLTSRSVRLVAAAAAVAVVATAAAVGFGAAAAMGGSDDPTDRPACLDALKHDGDTVWCVQLNPQPNLTYEEYLSNLPEPSPTATP
jgi:putative copper export protein